MLVRFKAPAIFQVVCYCRTSKRLATGFPSVFNICVTNVNPLHKMMLTYSVKPGPKKGARMGARRWSQCRLTAIVKAGGRLIHFPGVVRRFDSIFVGCRAQVGLGIRNKRFFSRSLYSGGHVAEVAQRPEHLHFVLCDGHSQIMTDAAPDARIKKSEISG